MARKPSAARQLQDLQGIANTARFQTEILQERLAELELALEDKGWIKLAGASSVEFSREGLRQINRLARLMYLKNPLIQRGVNVQAFYVFGQGISLSSPDDGVNAVIQDFIDNAKNKAELTSQQAMGTKEKELTLLGDIFFVFFTNASTGKVVMRSIPPDEVDEIVSNPEDRKDPWLYKRTWTQDNFNFSDGQVSQKSREAYYPDWRYQPAAKPQTIGGKKVLWDQPVYHVKIGGLSDMKFGVSEVYAALDWAKAYKEFLEDWSTITRAYARFAFQITTKGGTQGRAAAKAKLNTTVSEAQDETNPPPGAGSYFLGDPGVSINPIRTAGAAVSPSDGRRILLMVASVMGLPESFFGDVSVGNLATAKSLDRPTELKMKDRQTLWGDIFTNILLFVIEKSATATSGELYGYLQVEDQPDGTPLLTLPDDSSVKVKAEFPPILEHDLTATVSAIVSAATLNGGKPAGTMDSKTLSRLLLNALSVSDVDSVMEILFPEGAENIVPVQTTTPQEAAMLEAIHEFRKALISFQEKYSNVSTPV